MARHLSPELDVDTQPAPRLPYRLVYLGLGLIVVATLALAIAFGGSGDPTPLPPPIESLTPHPNDAVLSQAILEIDLEAGYRAEIFVDGFAIPPNEVTFVEATGVHRWQPRPNSLVMQTWLPGEHEVVIVWDSLSGLPSPGQFTWIFRVQ